MSINVSLPPEALEAIVKGAIAIVERIPSLVQAIRESSLSDERKAELLAALDVAEARVAGAEIRAPQSTGG